MKKYLMLCAFLFALIINAAAIKVFLVWEEVSKDCIRYSIFVTEDNGELIGFGHGQTGTGCDITYITTDPNSPNEFDALETKYPKLGDMIEAEIERGYREYQSTR